MANDQERKLQCKIDLMKIVQKEIDALLGITFEEACEATDVIVLGWLLEEIHMAWAHLEKKQTRLRTSTKSLEDLCIQCVVMASQA
ncbi:hypothetical protein Tco_0038978 [Tanacetum coccineum]